jgi:hypothetical protein
MRESQAALQQGRAEFDAAGVGFMLVAVGNVSGLYPFSMRSNTGDEMTFATPGPHFFAQRFERLQLRTAAQTGTVRLVVLTDYREWYDPTPVSAGPVAELLGRFKLDGTEAPYNVPYWLPVLNSGRFSRSWIQTADLTVATADGTKTTCGLRWRYVTSDGKELFVSVKYTDSTPQVAFVEFGSAANTNPLTGRGFTRIERPVYLQAGIDNALSGPTKYYYSGTIDVWGLP